MLCAWPLAQGALALENAPGSPPDRTSQLPALERALHAHAAPNLPVAAPSAPGMVRIPGDAPVGIPARPSPHLALDAVRTSRVLTITVVLKRTDQRGFDRYLAAVYNRHSSDYHHFLRQSQLADRFGPSVAEYHQVKSWLLTEGFRVAQSPPNRLSLTVRGTEIQAERAFDTPILTFPGGRRAVYGNTDAPAVPRRIASHIQAVMGLSDRVEPSAAPNHLDTGTSLGVCLAAIGLAYPAIGFAASGLAGAVAAEIFIAAGILFTLAASALLVASVAVIALVSECFVFAAGSSSPPPPPSPPPAPPCIPPADGGPCYTISRDLPDIRRLSTAAHRKTYSSADPSQKIGLLEFDTYRPSDVTDWLNLLGLDPSAADRLSEVSVNGGVSAPGAGESEVLVDIDSVLGIAPLAPTRYVVYDAPASTSFAQMFQAMIADGDTVISNSWAQCEDQTPIAEAQAIDSVLASAAGSGVTVVNGAGDTGSTCLDGSANTVAVPADSPHATAVGGTSPTFGPGLTYGHESWWDDQNATPPGGAGGFGVSRYFGRPSYQDGLNSSPMRSVPDLSFNAAPAAGVQLCQADAGGCPDGLLWGGTSMAAPEVAAEVADVNTVLGRNVGDLNTVLYSLAGTNAFHSAASMGSDFGHVGLGSPDFNAVYQRLAGIATGPASASVSVAAGSGQPQADGTQRGLVRIDLEDASGFPVGGKGVMLTPNSGSSAVVSPSSITTDATDGAAVFTVTDTKAETVTFTVTDTTDNVTLSTQPSLTFVTPAAAGAQIYGGPSSVPNDGSSKATIYVYLADALGRPAAGKTVSLSQTGGATISPATTAVTDSTGTATFQAADTTQQSVDFTATDISDGNLPAPGSLAVNFAPATAACNSAVPTPSGGYSASGYVTGLAFNTQNVVYPGNFTEPACSGQSPPAFDSSGNAYVADQADGTIHVFGAMSGIAGAGNELPDASFPAGDLGSLAFGKDGSLYAGLIQSAGSVSSPEIVQLDPTTGTTIRVIASHATGLPDCPFAMAVDPLSGDLFTDDECSGFAASNQITRIENPSSANPTVVDYINTASGSANDGLTFAPDGTLYVTDFNGSTCGVHAISGTNTGSATDTAVAVTTCSSSWNPSGVAVASTGANGAATKLWAFEFGGNVAEIDLTQSPAAVTTVASSTTEYYIGATSANGCAYAPIPGSIVRFGPSSCSAALTSSGPQITLSASADSSPTGSPVNLTAQLTNFPSVGGTPVHFTITGPNLDARLADADSSGHATVSDAGIFQGIDKITASAVVSGSLITSAPVQVHWTAGKDATFLDLNTGQHGGIVGRPATITTSMWDMAQSPAVPIAGQNVTLTLGGASCQTQTDSNGSASCALTPQTPGLLVVSASFAGSPSFTAAFATNEFVALVATSTPSGPPVRPQLTHFRLSPTKFRAAGTRPTRPSHGRHPPTGTTITYVDSLPATTTLTILETVAGVRHGKRCVAPPRHPQQGKEKPQRCQRQVVVGHLTHNDIAGTVRKALPGVREGKRCVAPPAHQRGKKKPKRCTRYMQVANTIPFTGRLHGRALGPGRYLLEAIAQINGLTSNPVTARFTIVR